MDADEAYEDWYLVESFGALGVLNDAAVSAETGVEHDRVAELSEGGAGGLYGLRAGVASLEATNATWLSKPRDAGYAPFLDRLRQLLSPRDALWQRRLVLGPAPEFCIGSKEPVLTKGLSALAVERSLIYAAP